MPAILYNIVRQSSRASDLGASGFALVLAISLAGLVLSFAMIHFGFDADYGVSILG